MYNAVSIVVVIWWLPHHTGTATTAAGEGVRAREVEQRLIRENQQLQQVSDVIVSSSCNSTMLLYYVLISSCQS